MIKFRGVPLEDVSEMRCVNFDGDFVYGYYIKDGDGALIVGDKTKELDEVGLSRWFASVDPKTVGQFTGLKDVNGKDIYVGDIVQPVSLHMNLKRGKPFEVKKGNYVHGKWIAKDISKKVFSLNGLYFSNEMQLIGNVHESPELLEEEK